MDIVSFKIHHTHVLNEWFLLALLDFFFQEFRVWVLYISERAGGGGGLGELVRWIPWCTELWQAKQAPWLPPGGLYWIFRSDTASGSTFNTDWVFTMCQILFQDFRDANSCNLHVIVWDKHYYFPHIPNGTVRQRGHVTCPRSLAGQWGAETGHWS